MSDTVIKVENLSKSYLISHQRQESYTALRDVLTNGAKSLARRFSSPFTSNVSPLTDTQEEFWALKDINFEVKRGDRVGIIGRNGAGKSTLLKVLSRITEPTSGRIEIDGRIASLLEVGTGFHPELTGRENIFLNGAILGMSRVDIKRKFDEIVAFAEVEKFLDTPVKRYSSGMYVRLAFAVAAHLEPEILIVDEVLAVGDAQFQKKCLGKMDEVGKEGRTVLFVSHNMAAIASLCDKGVLFDIGKVIVTGRIDQCIERYLENPDLARSNKARVASLNCQAVIKDAYLVDDKIEHVRVLSLGEQLKICVEYEMCKRMKDVHIHVGIYNDAGVGILRFESSASDEFPQYLPQAGRIECFSEGASLVPGRYTVNLCLLHKTEILDYVPQAFFFDVRISDFFDGKKVPDLNLCKVIVPHRWRISNRRDWEKTDEILD
ncbi:MAG: ABC transporter ATP-binding protein [Desulfuromonadales bacterium]